jgi:hypothetical protein
MAVLRRRLSASTLTALAVVNCAVIGMLAVPMYRDWRIGQDAQYVRATILDLRNPRRGPDKLCYEFTLPGRAEVFGPHSWFGIRGGCVGVSSDISWIASGSKRINVQYSASNPRWNSPEPLAGGSAVVRLVMAVLTPLLTLWYFLLDRREL